MEDMSDDRFGSKADIGSARPVADLIGV